MKKQCNRERDAICIEVENFNVKFKTFQNMVQVYRNRRKRFELRTEVRRV